MLPIKQSSRALLTDVARVLEPHLPQIVETWRRKMAEEFAFDERVLGVLERLNAIAACKYLIGGDFEGLSENLLYYGTRSAKLQVDTRAVARSLELCQSVCEPYLRSMGKLEKEAVAALDMVCSTSFVTISGAYFDAQRKEAAALVNVLDAELSAADLSGLLARVLEITTHTFNATLGLLLLRDPDGDVLRVRATYGFESSVDDDLCVNLGQGFSGRIAQSGEAAMLPDLSQSDGVLNPLLRQQARALWGVPLKHDGRVIGVLLIGFKRPYEWLPTERQLLRSIADRSALAIDRARMNDALREREMRIAELSGHLLKVQEEERKRISRELHDETGQALMVIRLYLGMLESSVAARTARGKIRETLGVVDRTIEGIRRIIGKLSPLVLQELGLIAAIRKEAKDLARGSGIKARVAISDSVGRLAPELETAMYRVVQEALHNVAKHSQAKSVNVQMTRNDQSLHLLIEDDGVGFDPAARPRYPSARRSFGLAGIRERVGMLGGSVRLTSARGKGTRLEVKLPLGQPQIDETGRSVTGMRPDVVPLSRTAAAGEPRLT